MKTEIGLGILTLLKILVYEKQAVENATFLDFPFFKFKTTFRNTF